MPEVQRHGFTFEEWVRKQFFGGYQAPSYTGHWDVPAERNEKFGGIPVSIKTAKIGTPIGFGDALRQFSIREDFLLIVGYWKQDGGNKRIVNTIAAPITTLIWGSLWAPITLNDLRELDSAIKDRTIGYQESRRRAQAIKTAPPFTSAAITLNPKIDSKTQRRLQCSIGFALMFDRVVSDATRGEIESPELFGIRVIEPFLSSPRIFLRPEP
jgi:hypothetical protein